MNLNFFIITETFFLHLDPAAGAGAGADATNRGIGRCLTANHWIILLESTDGFLEVDLLILWQSGCASNLFNLCTTFPASVDLNTSLLCGALVQNTIQSGYTYDQERWDNTENHI